MNHQMKKLFQTFKPKHPIIKKYVDYYYLDLKPNNTYHSFECFPHFNNTISLYRSHRWIKKGEVVFDKTASPLQIFTPIRKNVLSVKQLGEVYRIVLVFHPLGIQQFFRKLDFSEFIINNEFFTKNELDVLFSTLKIETLTDYLDEFLIERFELYESLNIENALAFIFKNAENFSVSKLSEHIGISRQHLNRIFNSHFGVSVKTFHKIVVFRQTIHQKLFENPASNFTELAHQFSYSDQSHFNKTYKSFTNNSPKTFFRKGTILGKEDVFWHLES